MLTAIPVVTLIWWNFTVRWLPTRSGEQPASFRLLKYLTIVVVVMQKKMKCQSVFLEGLRRQLSSFHRDKTAFKSGLNSPVHKDVSMQSHSGIKTLLGSTIPCLEKRSWESVLWVLTAIPIFTVIRWNCTVRWHPSKKCQTACFLQETQILDHSYCFKESKLCFSGRFESMIFQVSQGDYTNFAIRPQFTGSQKYASL